MKESILSYFMSEVEEGLADKPMHIMYVQP